MQTSPSKSMQRGSASVTCRVKVGWRGAGVVVVDMSRHFLAPPETSITTGSYCRLAEVL
jgi:hypothetical protein